MTNKKGKKDIEGKTRFDLVPFEMIEMIANAMTYGSTKYGENTWQDVEKLHYWGAMMRHNRDVLKGEKNDKESGYSHWDHFLCDAAMYAYLNKKEQENREEKE